MVGVLALVVTFCMVMHTLSVEPWSALMVHLLLAIVYLSPGIGWSQVFHAGRGSRAPAVMHAKRRMADMVLNRRETLAAC